MIKILGGDPQRIAEKVEDIVGRFLETNDPLSVSRLDGEEVNLADLNEELTASSLFNPERLVVVRDFDRCPELKATTDDKDKRQQLANLFDKITSSNQLVVTISPGAASSSAVNWLRKHPDYQELKPLDSQDLAGWLIARAESLGSKLDQKTASFLIDYYGPGGVGLATEVAKLSLHPEITENLIEKVVVPTQPEVRVFDLTAAIVKGQTERALEIYESFRVQNPRPDDLRGMLGLIIWQVKILVAVNTSRLPIGQLAPELGLKSDYALRKVQGLARRLPGSVLVKLVDHCLLADRQIRVDYQSPADCLPSLIIRASTACRR